MASGVIFSPEERYRIKYCNEAKRNVLQIKDGEDSWLCLHGDTEEEEHEDMKAFLEKYPYGVLINPRIPIHDLQLIEGHLVNPEKGIDICLWVTKPGDKPNRVTIIQ